MKNALITNYLRSCRKKTGFSQDEIAFLLDSGNGASVSRHERGGRLPALDHVLGYEVVYGLHAHQIFARDSNRIEAEIAARARRLLENVKRCPPSPRRMRKLKLLSELASRCNT